MADVRATGRLTDSAVVLAADESGPDLQVQRLMRRAGRAMMPARPILEVNPRHKLIEALSAKQDDKDLLKATAETLLDLAQGAGGRDPEGRRRVRPQGQGASGRQHELANSFPPDRVSPLSRYQNFTGTFCRASAGASKKASGLKPQGAATRLLGTVSRRVL